MNCLTDDLNVLAGANSLRNLCILCVSAVKIGRAHSITAETQRTQRLRREVLRSTKMFIDSADSQMSAAEECDMSWVKCHLTGLKKILKTFLGRFKDS
jgi:hypothetical protein